MTTPIVTVFDGAAIDEVLSRNKGALPGRAASEPPKADRTGLLDLGTEYLFAEDEEQPGFLATVLARVDGWILDSVILIFGIGSGVLWHVYATHAWEILRRWQYWIWTRLFLWLL